jgi:hypothetical protein
MVIFQPVVIGGGSFELASNYPRQGAAVVDNARHDGDRDRRAARLVLHWLLLFRHCPRHRISRRQPLRPAHRPGCADAGKYYEMVVGEPKAASQQLLRPLVPWVARPIYR